MPPFTYIDQVDSSSKPEAQIQAEIRDILKQVVSTVTFLPTVDEPTVFNILAYTSESADVPADEWVDTDPLAIEASKSQQEPARSTGARTRRDYYYSPPPFLDSTPAALWALGAFLAGPLWPPSAPFGPLPLFPGPPPGTESSRLHLHLCWFPVPRPWGKPPLWDHRDIQLDMSPSLSSGRHTARALARSG